MLLDCTSHADAHVRHHTCQAFIELASPVVGRRVHRVAKLTEIWETCADSGALPHDPKSVAVQTFRFTLRHYQNLNCGPGEAGSTWRTTGKNRKLGSFLFQDASAVGR